MVSVHLKNGAPGEGTKVDIFSKAYEEVFLSLRLHLGDEQLRDRLLFALPKKGRLYDQCVALLDRCGIKVGFSFPLF